MWRQGLVLSLLAALCVCAGPITAASYVMEFSLDIASDCEMSDPNFDGDEAFDPGDVYWSPAGPVSPPGQNGSKDDMFLFGGDPTPDPMIGSVIQFPGATISEYMDYFDLDGHDQLDFSLVDLLPPDGGNPIGQVDSAAVFPPKFLAISFDDDDASGWPVSDVPVLKPSPMGALYGTTAVMDEVIEFDLAPLGGNLYSVVVSVAFADEITVHPSLAPNPDAGDLDDDDVDSLDVVADPDLTPVWLFSADHEAHRGLDPGDIYESVGGTFMMVVDDVIHLGLPGSVDIDAFEFVWMELDEDAQKVLTLLFSVDQDDPLTPNVDESGGLDPKMVYYSHMTGWSQPLLVEPLADDIDAIANWGEPYIGGEESCDWGDAPDKPYPTLAANNGACHTIVPGMFLGATVDGEFDGQPTTAADGDDVLDASDDEDGVTLPASVQAGASVSITVTASMQGLLQGWVDFNANGSWGDVGEQVFIDMPLAPGANTLTFTVPANASCGLTCARFRFSSVAGLAYVGSAPDGEVEDYQFRIDEPTSELDWGDAPDQPYPTFAINNGARHTIVPGMMMGASIDGETDGQPHISALGDDVNDGNDDEDGVIFTSPLTPGGTATVTVTVTQPGILNAWIDFNNNGQWSDVGDHIFVDQPVVIGPNALSFPVPVTAQPGVAFCRFRYSTSRGLSYTGAAPDGEVEDYEHMIQQDPNKYDWGDAPALFAAGGYPTLSANNGARHVIGSQLMLGGIVDSETDGQPTTPADGDDVNGLADEDGVVFLTSIVFGQQARIDVIASMPGVLDAWIDYNADGDWTDPGEQIFGSLPVAAGVNTLPFTVPAAPVGRAIPSYARFRLSSVGGLAPTGVAPDGEVEDYAVLLKSIGSIVGAKFWDVNADGAVTVIEPRLGGFTIYADTNGNGMFDPTEPSAVTGSTGSYTLANLAPGTYVIREARRSLWRQTFPVPAGHTVTVTSGATVSAVDFLNWMLADVDFDKDVDGADIDAVGLAIRTGMAGSIYDLNEDGMVDSLDLHEIVVNLVFVNGNPANRGTCFGDADLDGDVDLSDFVILKTNFGTGSSWTQGDFDVDGDVDLSDFVILKNNFGC